MSRCSGLASCRPGSQIVGIDALYDVTADGQRFLINGPPADLGPPMTVVLNWAEGLK